MTRRDEWGQLLLSTPAVSHSLAKHLGVPGALPGAPLEEEVRITPWDDERNREWPNSHQLIAALPNRALCLHTGSPGYSRAL